MKQKKPRGRMSPSFFNFNKKFRHQLLILHLFLLLNLTYVNHVLSHQKGEAFKTSSEPQSLSHADHRLTSQNSTPDGPETLSPQTFGKDGNHADKNAPNLSIVKPDNEPISRSHSDSQSSSSRFNPKESSHFSSSCKANDREVVWGSRLKHSCFFSHVLIEPAFLDLGNRDLCTRVSLTLSIYNSMDGSDFTLMGAESNNPFFSTAELQPIIMHPGNNFSMEIEFSSPRIGSSDAVLKVLTNKGTILVPMYARVVPNLFQLNPIAGFYFPQGNNTYPLSIHNPLSHEIIIEAYSDDSFLILHPSQTMHEHVNGETLENIPQSKRLKLKLDPHKTMPLIDVEFTSEGSGYYMGTIQIKIANAPPFTDTFSVPVTIRVFDQGLHQVSNEIEFGFLTKHNQEVQKPVEILNTGPFPIQIQDIHLRVQDLNLIKIDFNNTVIPPMSSKAIATLTYFALHPTHSSITEFSWKQLELSVKTNVSTNQIFKVSYQAHVAFGSLDFPEEDHGILLLPAHFHSRSDCKSEKMKEKEFTASYDILLRNTFSFPIVLHFIRSLNSQFQLTNFSVGSLLFPNYPTHIFSVRLTSLICCNSLASSNISIFTNVSRFDFTLQAIPAGLHFSIEGKTSESAILHSSSNTVLEKVLDIGLIGVGYTFVKKINISNPLPKATQLNVFHSGLPDIKLTLNDVWDGEGNAISNQEKLNMINEVKALKESKSVPNFLNFGYHEQKYTSFQLRPNHTASFFLKVTPKQSEKRKGSLFFLTSSESFVLNVTYASVAGGLSLEPNSIRFDARLPVSALKKDIYATSSLPISLENLVSSHACIKTQLITKKLIPGEKTLIGRVSIDSSILLSDERNSQEKELELIGRCQALNSLTPTDCKVLQADRICHPGSMIKIWGDKEEKSLRQESAWRNMLATGLAQFSSKITLEADIIGTKEISVDVNLNLPRLLTGNGSFNFSKVMVGQKSKGWIQVFNPTNESIVLQLNLSSSKSENNCVCKKKEDESNCFTAPMNNRLWDWMKYLRGKAPKSISVFDVIDGKREFILLPHANTTIGPIFFAPLQACKFSSVFLLNNNLTKIESFKLEGIGDLEQIDFLEMKQNRILYFQISSSQLGLKKGDDFQEVNRPGKGDSFPREFSVKQNFTIINSGDFPVQVVDVSVCSSNRLGCRSRGFRIESKKFFDLQPGNSRLIVVSYRPDFSASVIKQELRLRTSSGIHFFPLIAQLPHEMLPVFLDSIPEMGFEKLFHQICLLGLGALVIFFTHSIMRDFTISPSPWFLPSPDLTSLNLSSPVFANCEKHRENKKVPPFNAMQNMNQNAELLEEKPSPEIQAETDCKVNAADEKDLAQNQRDSSSVTMDKKLHDPLSTSAPVSPSNEKEKKSSSQLHIRAFSEGRNGSMDISAMAALEATNARKISDSNKVVDKEGPSKKVTLKNNPTEPALGHVKEKKREEKNANSVSTSQNYTASNSQPNVNPALNPKQGKKQDPPVVSSPAMNKKADILKPSGHSSNIPPIREASSTHSLTSDSSAKATTVEAPPPKSPTDNQFQSSSEKSRKKKKKHTPQSEPPPVSNAVVSGVTTTSVSSFSSTATPPVSSSASATPTPQSPVLAPQPLPTSPKTPILSPPPKPDFLLSQPRSSAPPSPALSPKSSTPSFSFSNPQLRPIKTQVSPNSTEGSFNSSSKKGASAATSPTKTFSRTKNSHETTTHVPKPGVESFTSSNKPQSKVGKPIDMDKGVGISHTFKSNLSSNSGDGKRQIPKKSSASNAIPLPSHEPKTNGSQNSTPGSKTVKNYQRNNDARTQGNIGSHNKEVSVQDQAKIPSVKSSKSPSVFLPLTNLSTPSSSKQKSPASPPILISTSTEFNPSLNTNLPESLFSPSDSTLESSVKLQAPYSSTEPHFISAEEDRGGSTTSMLKLPSFVDSRDTVLERPTGRRWPSKPLSPPGGISSSFTQPQILRGIHTPPNVNHESTVAVGFPDELGLIGKKSLEQVDGSLGKMVYNIWGDYFPEVGAISSPRLSNITNNNNNSNQFDLFNHSLFTQTGFTPPADMPNLPTSTIPASDLVKTPGPHSPVGLVQEGAHSPRPGSPFSVPFPGFSIFSETSSPRAVSRSSSPPLISWNAPASESPQHRSPRYYAHGPMPSRLHPQTPLGSGPLYGGMVAPPTPMDTSFWTKPEMDTTDLVSTSEDSQGGSYSSLDDSLLQDKSP